MKKHWMLAVLCGCLMFSAQAALEPGDQAPAFTAQASLAGKASAYSLRDDLAKGPAVVYFYPSAFTNGCNLQAHLFSQNSEKFAAAGASVVGVSLDSIARLNAFSADPQYCAGKVRVASDVDGSIGVDPVSRTGGRLILKRWIHSPLCGAWRLSMVVGNAGSGCSVRS